MQVSKKMRRKKISKKKKKSKIIQRFNIHYSGFLSGDNRKERSTGKKSTTLELDMNRSEGEIRNLLISELLQLKGKKFEFFTMDDQGKGYPCPCSQKCEGKDHSLAEWNAKNIAVVANGNRAVYIKIGEDVQSQPESATSGYDTIGLSENQGQLDPLEAEVREAGSLRNYLTSEVSSEPPLEVEKIVPQEGNVEGGYDFALFLRRSCIDGFKVQFGETDPIVVKKRGESVVEGKVPASSIVGEVEVKIVETLRAIKNTTVFKYTDENLETKHELTELTKNLDAAGVQELLMALAKRVGEMSLKSKEETTRFDDSGGGKTCTLPLFRMIAVTAARINAIPFFEILFRTHVGCTLNPSFKHHQPPLEEIARANGHEELALLLEKKHLMFRDDESDSDDGIDWKAISKAIGEYQAKHDESVEKWSLRSTDSSENVHGYFADGENSASLSSFQVSIDETCDENTFEEELVPPVLSVTKELEICHSHSEIKGEDKKTSATSSPIHLSFEDQEVMPVYQDGAESGVCHTNGENNAQGKPGSAESWPDTVIKGCFDDTFEEKRASTNIHRQDRSQVCDEDNERSKEKRECEESYVRKSLVFKYPERSADHTKKETEMGGDHKCIEEKIKLIVRSYSEPVLFPFDDVFGRNWTNFSTKEVEKLKKILAPFPTKQIGDNEACCNFLTMDVREGLRNDYPKTMKSEFGRRKRCHEMKSPLHFPTLTQEHSEIDCSYDSASFTSEYLSAEFEKRVPCVPVNKLWTEPEFIDLSKPPNTFAATHPNTLAAYGNRKKEKWRRSFLSFLRVILLTVVLMIPPIMLFYFQVKGSEQTTFPTQSRSGLQQTTLPTQSRSGLQQTTFSTHTVKTLLASSPCNERQHWIKNLDGTSKCLDCKSCPPGRTVSPECGNSKPLPHNTKWSCVPCQLGKSFSNGHSTFVCTPCSRCADDQVVRKQCSRKADIKCGKKCYSEARYYDESKGKCLNCSQCCNDDQDVVESECKGKLGSQSSKICSFRSRFDRCNFKSALKTFPQFANQSSYTVTVPITDANATEVYASEVYTNARFASKSRDHNDSSSLNELFAVLVVLVTVFGMILSWCIYMVLRWSRSHRPECCCLSRCVLVVPRVKADGGTYTTKRTEAHCNSGSAQVELFEPLLESDGVACPSLNQTADQLVTKSDSKPLRDLLDSSELEEICNLLDEPIRGKLSYEAIARYYGASFTQIKAWFQDGKSESVIAWLVAKKPEVTIKEFALVARENAGRADVAVKLKDLM